MFNFLETYFGLSPDGADGAFVLLLTVLAVILVVLLGLLWLTRINPNAMRTDCPLGWRRKKKAAAQLH
jgi:hypothetical protein